MTKYGYDNANYIDVINAKDALGNTARVYSAPRLDKYIQEEIWLRRDHNRYEKSVVDAKEFNIE